MKRYPGRVKLVFRAFPIPGHPHADTAAEASEWARDQGIFWPFHDAMFDDPKALDTESLVSLAGRLGKDGESLRKALADRKYRERVQSGLIEGRRAGVVRHPDALHQRPAARHPRLLRHGARVRPRGRGAVDEERLEGLSGPRPMRRFLAHRRPRPRGHPGRRRPARAGRPGGHVRAAPLRPRPAPRRPRPGLRRPHPAPGATLAGDLAAFPLADFLGFVHQARLTGTLTVLAGGGAAPSPSGAARCAARPRGARRADRRGGDAARLRPARWRRSR